MDLKDGARKHAPRILFAKSMSQCWKMFMRYCFRQKYRRSLRSTLHWSLQIAQLFLLTDILRRTEATQCSWKPLNATNKAKILQCVQEVCPCFLSYQGRWALAVCPRYEAETGLRPSVKHGRNSVLIGLSGCRGSLKVLSRKKVMLSASNGHCPL